MGESKSHDGSEVSFATATTSSAADAQSTLGLTALILLMLSLEAIILICRPLPMFDPDESLFAVVAREMRERGEYYLPTYRGKPFLDRPILHYWMMIGALELFGDNDVSRRLPSFLCGTATTLLLIDVGRRLYGLRAGLLAGYVLATTVAGTIIRWSVGHDSSLILTICVSAWVFIVREQTSSSGRRTALAVGLGISLGLGLLAKGMLGIALPAMLFLSGYLFAGWRIDLPRLALALLVAFLTGLGWYAYVETCQPGYCRYFLFERHVMGFVSDEQRHGGRSVLIYIPTLLAGGAPGIFLLASPRVWRSQHPSDRILFSWLGLMLLFFAAAGSKNPTYLLPTSIPIALLVGKRLEGWFGGEVGSQTIDAGAKYLPPIWWFANSIVFVGLAIYSKQPIMLPVLLAILAVGAVPLLWTLRTSGNFLYREERSRFYWLLPQACAWSATLMMGLLWTGPMVLTKRSTFATIAELDRLVEPNSAIHWVGHVPPSIRLYRPDWRIDPIHTLAADDVLPAGQWVVCRDKDAEILRASAMLTNAVALNRSGRYKVFRSTAAINLADSDPLIRR